MAIETYLIEDSEKMIAEPEHLEEWQKIVDSLGLEGQKKLVSVPEKSPIPFPMMKVKEERVYETLCPNKTGVKDYSNNTIPLRVLSLIALAEQERYFDKIEIWDDNAAPDPVAIGYKKIDKQDKKFILARWGDELRAFVELEQLAVKKWIDTSENKLKKNIVESKSKLENINNLAEQYFQGDWIYIY